MITEDSRIQHWKFEQMFAKSGENPLNKIAKLTKSELTMIIICDFSEKEKVFKFWKLTFLKKLVKKNEKDFYFCSM